MAKEKKEKKGGQQEEQKAPAVARHSAKDTPRLKARFQKEVEKMKIGKGKRKRGGKEKRGI